jgi:hypothetical protein
MRPLGMLASAAVMVGLLAQPAWSQTSPKNAKPKQVAQQRQIICTQTIGGCREVKPGCRIEIMQSKYHDLTGVQREVCPGDAW